MLVRPWLEALEDRRLLAAWNFETVHDFASPASAWITGFDFDPANQRVVGFNQFLGNTGNTTASWSRETNDVWQTTQLFDPRFPGGAESDYGHRLVLRDDGTPFVIFAAVAGLDYYLWRADLGDDPDGPGQPIEYLAHYQSVVAYDSIIGADFAPGASTPSYVRAHTSGFNGHVFFNGQHLAYNSMVRGVDYAAGPNGETHILYAGPFNSPTGGVYYSNGIPSQQRDTGFWLNRFSGDISVAVDQTNRIHAVIRGMNGFADSDLGDVRYITSADNGVTWTNMVVDATHAAHSVKIALDANDVPHISFYRSGELRYASLVGGQWTSEVVTTAASGGYELAFNRLGDPGFAFYDFTTTDIKIATAGLVIQPPLLPEGLVDAPYSQTLTVTTSLPPSTYTYSVLSGSLPPGLSLSSSGVISGTPTTTGTSPFTVRVSDALGHSDQRAYTINVVTCVERPSGLVDWWSGEGNAADSAGANPGILQNGITFGAGQVDQALRVDGIDDMVTVSASASLSAASATELSLEL